MIAAFQFQGPGIVHAVYHADHVYTPTHNNILLLFKIDEYSEFDIGQLSSKFSVKL